MNCEALRHALGERVRKLRQMHDLKQQALATMIGAASHSTITDIENGKRMPSTATLDALAEVFHVSVDYLLGKTPSDAANNPEVLALKASLRSELERISSWNEDISGVVKHAKALLDAYP
jgi:transcriptional regulator with XRE-family HTH domain